MQDHTSFFKEPSHATNGRLKTKRGAFAIKGRAPYRFQLLVFSVRHSSPALSPGGNPIVP